MPRIDLTPLAAGEVRAALDIWASAQTARDLAPSPGRRERVSVRLHQAVGSPHHLALLARYGGRPAGMALAEPYADSPGTGHVSMVFVTPAYWGCRIGSTLLERLQDPGAGWSALSLWTRTANTRALRLYRSAGFVDTGERSSLGKGEEILRLSWPGA